jgi:transposase
LTPPLRPVRWHSVVSGRPQERGPEVIVIGIDPHKRTHTAAAVEQATGEVRGERTVTAHERGQGQLLLWARSLARERVWALEDCRHVSARLERFLLARGERVVRVPPGRMAGARREGRERGKSDAIDALAIARAFLREPDLPEASLAGAEREIRLLADHREDLVGERTRIQNRLRWHLHDLDGTLEVPAGALDRFCWLDRLDEWLAARGKEGAQARIGRELVGRCRELTRRINELERELEGLLEREAEELLVLVGCGTLTAAKLVGEVAGVDRFAGDAKLAKHTGTAPLPASSGAVVRHRLNRSGNRQLNCALHRIAVTQARMHPPARAYLERKQAEGKSRREALRCLKRHLARTVYRTLRTMEEKKITSSEKPVAVPALT